MELELKLPKGLSLPLGNSLRQIAMSRLPAWRPIAISLDRDFNTLHATADIPEDMPSIMAMVTDLLFIPKTEIEGTFLKEKFTFNKVLRTSDLVSDHFSISGSDNVLMTCLSENSVTLTILYRFGYGEMTIAENADLIVENGERREEYMVFNSRHTDVNNFSFDIRAAGLMDEILILRVESDTQDEMKILKESLKNLEHSVALIGNLLESKNADLYYEKEAPSQKILGVR